MLRNSLFYLIKNDCDSRDHNENLLRFPDILTLSGHSYALRTFVAFFSLRIASIVLRARLDSSDIGLLPFAS